MIPPQSELEMKLRLLMLSLLTVLMAGCDSSTDPHLVVGLNGTWEATVDVSQEMLSEEDILLGRTVTRTFTLRVWDEQRFTMEAATGDENPEDVGSGNVLYGGDTVALFFDPDGPFLQGTLTGTTLLTVSGNWPEDYTEYQFFRVAE